MLKSHIILLSVIIILIVFYKNIYFTQFILRNKPCPDHIAVLILARGGSQGIPLKNIALIDGEPLIVRTLKTVIQSPLVTSIWVSTDNENIANISVRAGPNISIHWRSKLSATNEATSLYAVQEFLQYHEEVDALILIQCTSPFLQLHYLNDVILKLKTGFDSVFTVTRQYKLRWKLTDDNIIADNFNPKKRPRRQDWSGELIENGMIYGTLPEIIKAGSFQDGRIAIVEVPFEDSLEIDNPIDLINANSIIKHRNSFKNHGI